MGLLNKLFGAGTSPTSGSEEQKKGGELAWTNLNTVEQLDTIAETSKTKTQIIFKHSTRCGVSRMVISQFKKDYGLSEKEADLYYLDLLNYRTVSSAISEKFKVRHESPQLLVIKDGAVVAHESHSGINSLSLGGFVQ